MREAGRARHVERRERQARTSTESTSNEAPTARKSADERWVDILAVSARMFSERGYSSTSLQQIADELNLLKGSLYYYINSKDDLLYEIIRTVYWQGVANLREYSASGGSGLDRLRTSIEGHVRHVGENLTATSVFLHEFNQLSEQRQEELSLLDYSGLIRDLIKQGQDDGSIRTTLDASMASMFILGATNWVYRWYRPEQGSITEIAHQFAEIATVGLAPAADGSDRAAQDESSAAN